MELAMFAGAAVAYVIFVKGISMPSRAAKKAHSSGSSVSDVHTTEKELLAHLAKGDHRSVVRLWQRVKSLDRAPAVPLINVVGAMRTLGWPANNIVEELKSAVEC